MTKEQEVIEYFKKQIESCSENADICDDNNFNEEAAYLRKQRYMYKTVLNMLNKYSAESAEKDKIIAEKSAEIEKKNKEIEKLTIKNKDLLRKLRNRVRDVKKLQKYSLYKKEFSTLNKQIKEKDAEIEKLKTDFKIVDQECSRLERKEAKQDKMIDLMAEELQTHMFVVSVGKTIIGKKGIKEYYEQKATNDV